ncbi:MAG: hypothetical protein E4H28_00905, partial [Gemmatimonadales bacterium]
AMTEGDSGGSAQLDWLPEKASLIAVVREAGAGEWAAGVAVGLADIVGRTRGRTYLANAAGDGSELDLILNVEGGLGLASALSGVTSVASIARSASERSFAYLPAGDSALPLSELRRIPMFRRLLRKMRDGGGTLLLYLAEEDLTTASGEDTADGLSLDGCIALGHVRDLALNLGAPLLARVERPVDALNAVVAGREDLEEPATGQDVLSGSSRLGSLGKLLIPVTGLVLLWAVWMVSRPSGEVAASTEVPAVGAVTAGDVAAAEVELAPPVWTAPAADYSVLVGSYIRLGDAEESRGSLSRDGGLFYVAPTPVRDRVYFRVFAGVYEDRQDALAAMDILVANGQKKVAKLWDVRPVRLGYDLGTFDSMNRATDRVRSLATDGIPAYVLRDRKEAPSFRVFAGAFESEEAATAMSEMLESRELNTKLITRSGVAP